MSGWRHLRQRGGRSVRRTRGRPEGHSNPDKHSKTKEIALLRSLQDPMPQRCWIDAVRIERESSNAGYVESNVATLDLGSVDDEWPRFGEDSHTKPNGRTHHICFHHPIEHRRRSVQKRRRNRRKLSFPPRLQSKTGGHHSACLSWTTQRSERCHDSMSIAAQGPGRSVAFGSGDE
jgi:hypothetical protein